TPISCLDSLEDFVMQKAIAVLAWLSLSVLFLCSPPAHAEWSDDPLQNLGISVTTGDQVLPKIGATSDGGCYISWFDNRSGNYSVYLQRLNSVGDPQWTANGLVISDHTQQSWIVDYDMTVDHEDNAIVVFSDIRNGAGNSLDVVVYKIAPDATFLWGADGIGLSDAANTAFEPDPKVTVTTDNNVVVAWMKSDAADLICFQKIAEDGQKLWGPSGINLVSPSGESLSAPDVAPADSDEVIALFKSSTGPPWAPTTHLYTQKFTGNGSEAWTPSGVLIYDAGTISAWTDAYIYSDGNGGALYTWYDSPSLSDFCVWVQRVDADGDLVYPMNGIKASTNTNDRLHMNPSLSYMPDTDEVFVFWVESNFSQTQYGVYGQKISSEGVRLWTDSGYEYVALTSSQIAFVQSEAGFNSLYVGYFAAPTVMNNSVNAFRVDRDGNLLCPVQEICSATLGSKDDLVLAVNNENRAFFAWEDMRNDEGDLYAQNMNFDGAMGNALRADATTISTATGGTVNFTLTTGAGNAGRNYLILGGATGIDPGTVLPGGFAMLPLNMDIVTDIFLTLINTVVFPDFFGQLDGSGSATAQFVSPPLPTGFEGTVFCFAFCMNNFFDFASNHVEVTIVD
ncbi:MAG: hypothetical protein ABIK28_21000, partial [Planctomycetota bacterium]